MTTTITTPSGIPLQADAYTIKRVRARAWQALIMAVCAAAGAAIVAIWLLCCAISGCDGAPEPALAYNIQRGIYGDELCDSDDLWHGFHARQMPGLLTTEVAP